MCSSWACSGQAGRCGAAIPPNRAACRFLFSLLGFGLAGVTGWLGGELVDRLGVGVDDGANLNAPSSLSEQPAEPA